MSLQDVEWPENAMVHKCSEMLGCLPVTPLSWSAGDPMVDPLVEVKSLTCQEIQ